MSAERLREMLSKATPGPWEARAGEGAGVWAHGFRRLERGSYGSAADLSVAALAPDAMALLADFGELLQAWYDDIPIETSAGKELLRRLDALCGDDRA